MVLHLGDIYGGPELEHGPAYVIAHKLFQVKETYQDEFLPRGEGELDLVFEYPGSIKRPEFAGIRTGRFSRKAKMLQIQIAVPAAKMKPEVFGPFYVDAVEKAVKLGKAYFDKKQIAFSEDKHLALVNKLREALDRI